MKNDREYYICTRVCTAGQGEQGIRGNDTRAALASGDKQCPIERKGIVVSMERGWNAYDAAQVARNEAVEVVGGWCEDPCTLCKSTISTDGSTHIQEIDHQSFELARKAGVVDLVL